MKKDDFLRLKENSLVAKGFPSMLCGKQFLLIDNDGNYELVPDGFLDEGEIFDEVYRLNIFGKLVKMSSYRFM